eukprot:gene6769-34025_t
MSYGGGGGRGRDGYSTSRFNESNFRQKEYGGRGGGGRGRGGGGRGRGGGGEDTRDDGNRGRGGGGGYGGGYAQQPPPMGMMAGPGPMLPPPPGAYGGYGGHGPPMPAHLYGGGAGPGSDAIAAAASASGIGAGAAAGGGKATAADGKPAEKKPKKVNRMAAGQKWSDTTLDEWDKNDFRIFVGDLGNEVTDEGLARGFAKYPTLLKAKVIREKRSGKSKGYGFVSFKDPNDFMKALREMNGKYVGNRPVKLRKSTWKDRDAGVVKKKERKKKSQGHLGGDISLYSSKGVPTFAHV